MAEAVPGTIVRLVRNRHALLWVCQRHELLAGETPHSYDLAEAQAILRYRAEANDSDKALASLYWESVWLEGARSEVLNALQQAAATGPVGPSRPAIVLSTESDSKAQISTQEFLPVWVLPGLLDPTAPRDGRYGALRARQRERIAWSLSERLATFPGRALVVVGASTVSDLKWLNEILEDSPVVDLHVLMVWPAEKEPPPLPANPGVHVSLWSRSTVDLVAGLKGAGAPLVGQLPKWSMRIGKAIVELHARDVHRVEERFAILTESDLMPPRKFDLDDMNDFLSGNEDSWAAFGAGLVVKRGYQSDEGRSLLGEIEKALELLASDATSNRTYTIELPCEGGSGATTMLRNAAFLAASEGYPTLILRPEQVSIDSEGLLAFATAVSEAALAANIPDPPPLVIIFDVEHLRLAGVGQLPQLLAAHGRRAVIIRALPFGEQGCAAHRSARRVCLPPLRAEASIDEIAWCESAVRSLVQQWNLPIEVPSQAQWRGYEAATQMRSPTGVIKSSHFWVGLRYFLTEGMEADSANRTRSSLAQWVAKRASSITDPDMSNVVKYVAALSAMRIIGPLWTVLRPVTGGAFTSALVETLQQIGDVLVWGDYSSELEDHVLRFRHMVLAEELLREQGIEPSLENCLQALAPVLTAMSPGHPGDLWVAESIATMIVPAFAERRGVDWEWRLCVFEQLPLAIRDSNKTILHHWARCLYLSADVQEPSMLSIPARRSRFEMAIDRLKKATELPRRPAQDEHPSHLFNTLGTAYYRYARFLGEIAGDDQAEATAWEQACRAFEESIARSDGSNIEAFIAFSRRLIDNLEATSGASPSSREVGDLARALSLLDDAEELIQQYENPNEDWIVDLRSTRARALHWLNLDAYQDYIKQLKDSGDPDLGYYCEARLAQLDPDPERGLHRALEILNSAEHQGVRLGRTSTLFMISLLNQHSSERYNFPRLLQFYRSLESDPNYLPSAMAAFRTAVLCYQVGDYEEGAGRFRRLRDRNRRAGIAPLRVRDLWRDNTDPTRPRQTHVRVRRVTTEWRADGYIDEFKQTIPLRPRHFSPPPKTNDIVACVVRFEINGPLAVPPRFEEGDRRREVHRSDHGS